MKQDELAQELRTVAGGLVASEMQLRKAEAEIVDKFIDRHVRFVAEFSVTPVFIGRAHP